MPVPGLVLRLLRRDRARRLDAEARARVARPRADVRLISATRGFKSGGFNIRRRRRTAAATLPSGPGAEAGLKTNLAGGRAAPDLAAFRTELHGPAGQTSIRPGVLDISNAAEATISGVELEVSLAIVPGSAWADAWPGSTPDTTATVARWRRRRLRATSPAAGSPTLPSGQGAFWLEWSQRGPARDVSPRRLALAEHRLLHAVQRRRPAPEPLWSAGLSAELGPRRFTVSAYARSLTDEGLPLLAAPARRRRRSEAFRRSRGSGAWLAVRWATKQP